MATRKHGKPYIWVTWLSKLLGGNRCVWSAWFKAHFKYEKFEEQASNLVEWNRNHTRLMAQCRAQLEADGWTVSEEEENAFRMEGTAAVVAGKPDIVAVKPGRVLVVDGKTGRERDSDIWQVLLYLYAVPKSRPDLTGTLEGEVHYPNGEISLTTDELTLERMSEIVALVKAIAADEPPKKVPSRAECQRCNIGRQDCPQRVMEARPIAVGDF